jgi:hypothetical protein
VEVSNLSREKLAQDQIIDTTRLALSAKNFVV